ncbi:MAG: VPLPA-CTERM sorting domain-containing protein, partial [Gammaproteobacteria bacterium]
QPLLNADLSFVTTNQSMWGNGPAFQFDYDQFVGLDINPAPVVYGSGSGDTVRVSVPVVGTYSANPYLQFDSDFKVGVQLGASISSGTIDANLDFNVNLAAPERIRRGEGFSLLGSATRLGTSGFATAPASASAYIDGIVEAYFGAYARVEYTQPGILADYDYRFGNRGFTSNNTSNSPYYTLVNINERQEIIGINRNASGVVRYLGGTNLADGDPLYDQVGAGSSVALGPVSVTAGNFNVFSSGALNGNTVSGSGAETLATVALDIDQLLVGSAALGQGIAHDWGAIDYDLGYDIVDVNTTMDINLQQHFDISSDLLVHLLFDKDVLIDGIGTTREYLGLVDAIPEITLFDGQVDVTPTFLVDASLSNATALAFVGSLNTTLLEAHAEIGWDISGNRGSRGYNLGPVYDSSVPLGAGSIDVFSDVFALAGFDAIQGTSFQLTTVPLPPAAWLFASALAGLAARNLRRRSA